MYSYTRVVERACTPASLRRAGCPCPTVPRHLHARAVAGAPLPEGGRCRRGSPGTLPRVRSAGAALGRPAEASRGCGGSGSGPWPGGARGVPGGCPRVGLAPHTPRAPGRGLGAGAVRARRCGGAAPASGREAAPPLRSCCRSATFGQTLPPPPRPPAGGW